MAKPELGLKHRCMTCGAKFYDLNRNPITCPKCGTPVQTAPLTRAPAPAAARARDDEEPETEAAGPDLVSLEDVVVEEAGDDTPIEDTADDGADAVFLEEEESEDDVSDFIEGDIENDDEV